MEINKRYILALDQGTSSSRVIVLDRSANVIAITKRNFKQIYSKLGWIEHDPEDIWISQNLALMEALSNANIEPHQIAAIGITNQRETVMIWDRDSGNPIYNAIVWQDSRTADYCIRLKNEGLENYIKNITGLMINPYFSGTKAKWILDHIDVTRKRAKCGKLLFGTVDSWLIWKMTEGRLHITDYTNASRTMMFNIHTLEWDQCILEILNIPRIMLPEVKSSCEIYGQTNILGRHYITIPIAGIIGDQQSSLYGQFCIELGMTKSTYGTGCFIMMHTGNKAISSSNGLLTTIACGPHGEVNYALEGSIFTSGSLIQWLRDKLKLINNFSDSEILAKQVEDTNGVYIVPALTGLGAPYWNPYTYGAILGLTLDTNINHLVRASLESIAYQARDIIEAMQNDTNTNLEILHVDGGAVVNNFLMQFQSDILGIKIKRSKIYEITALGAAYLAGLAVGFWENVNELREKSITECSFYPKLKDEKRNFKYSCWKKAIKCVSLLEK